jgi:adenosylcobinamide kinase/adenosylcobinamide-phosphate guanylyltransferase
MARIHLITGGGRSGKSSYAQRLAESLPGPRAYIATSPIIDDEMAERVRKHQQARSGGGWETIEEPVDLAGAVRRAGAFRVLLVDCLTLWANNLLYETEKQGGTFTEEEMAGRCRELIDACGTFPGEILLVTNELGMGIIPENKLARQFRDVAGRMNQLVATAADRVTLMVSGIILPLKELK